MRGWNRCGFLALAAFAFAACSSNAPTTQSEKLARVAPVAKPALPAWISSISPTSRAQSLAQIRVIFSTPVAPLAALEGDGPQNVLAHVRIEPALKGRFVLFTPTMIGFVAEEALPVATRVRVTLTSGLADLAGDRLTSEIAWTFETAPLEFTGLPKAVASAGESMPTPAALRPKIPVVANAAVDAASLAAHATLDAGGTSVPLDATLEPTPTPQPSLPPDAQAAFDESQRTWTYDLVPRGDLKRATEYRLTVAPGVEPARGNVATAKRFTGGIRTFDALTVWPTPSPDVTASPGSRFAKGDPVITFNNPIDEKTIAGNVTIAPSVSPSPKVVLSGDSAIAIDPYAFAPDSRYTVTIGEGVKDVFGQSLPSAKTIDVRTSDFAPGIWAPYGSTLIPANAGVDVNLYATNLPGNSYRAAFARISALDFLTNAYMNGTFSSHASDWDAQSLPDAKRNVQSVVRVNVQNRLHSPFGALAYGFWSPVLGADTYAILGAVQLTNLGVFAQFFPSSGTVMVQHLDDGSPATNADITVYRMSTNSHDQCASGTTDAAGRFELSTVDLERCYVNASQNQLPELAVVATSGADVAAVRVADYSGIYRYEVPWGWASGAPDGVGTIFPDRDLYQPGERGAFTGIAYYTQGGVVHADTNARYSLMLQDPSGGKTSLGTVTTDAYGTFSKPYTFSATQPLGYYTITGTSDRGAKITGNFRIAEFKPPNFKLDMTLDKTSAVPGMNVQATGTASYLFGAPLAGGNAHVYVTRAYATLAPKGWDDFWFGRQWFWPEQQPSIRTDVLQQQRALDEKGVIGVRVGVPKDLPAPLRYTVEIEASDVSNLSVSNAQSFLAMPLDAAIGLASDTVSGAKSPMTVRVIVTDAGGKPVSGRNVHLELQKMTYVSAPQAEEGGEEAQQSIRYDTVDRTDVTSGNAPVTATLRPSDAGSYRIRANFAGAASDASASDLQVFAYGTNAADFGMADRSSVRVTLDKKTYKIGDTATALIGSPFDTADVYVAVVRYGTIYRTVLHDVRGAPRVTFKVTPEMFPNAALEAVVVRRGVKLASVKPGTLDSLSRTGMAGFSIDLHDRYLHLGIDPAQRKLAPGGAQRIAFTLSDENGHPARGKVIAMAVNDAILQLSGYRLPDLVTTVFANQPISTRFADNREDITLQTPQAPVEKGFGYGGGFLEGAAGTRVRTNFLPLAYYGSAVTDASGRASVQFTVPDDLTTWRVMAVAIGDGNTRFATSDATFMTQLPLMANPLLPQFGRPGDRIDLGAAIVNETGGAGSLNFAMQLSGALHFVQGDPANAHITVATPQGMSAYRFPVSIGSPAPSTIAANASLASARDAFSVPFDIRDRATTESVVDAGAGSKQLRIPVHFTQPGTVTITLANSIVPQIRLEASRALAADPLKTTNELASRVIIASATGSAQTLAGDLASLEKLQRDDGGFSYYSGQNATDAVASAYALQALVFARTHRVSVDSGILSRAAAYARAVLANPSRGGWCSDDVCKAQTRLSMLWALADYGERRSDGLESIYALRDKLDNADQLRLARYMLATPGWQHTGKTYAETLEQTLYFTGRYASANLNTRWAWLGQVTNAQAQMLSLLLERRAPLDQLDGAARALIAQKCRCGWPTVEATASAVMALMEYSARVPPSAMHITVRDGASQIVSASFGSRPDSKSLTVAAASLHGNELVLQSDKGTMHYVLLYTYALPPESPGNLSAFRVTRRLYEPGNPRAFATIDLATPSSQLTMRTGSVFDVGIRIAVDHPVDRLVIEDPLPAGFEAIDASFSTSIQSIVPQTDNWEIAGRQIYRDRVVAFAAHVGPGVYDMHYLVRSVTPGLFRWPGARAYLEDAPEEFGRSATATLELK